MEEKLVYHCIIGCRDRQLSIGEVIISPFKESRDYTRWPKYKQCAEKLLENYRMKYHPDYPSRNDCLFVCKDEDSAKEWGMYKCRTSGCDNFYIYSLNIIEGEVLYFDTEWFELLAAILSNGEIPYSSKFSLKDCVKEFWAGRNMRTNEASLSEGLFMGNCGVSNIRRYHYDPMVRQLEEITK